MAAKPFNQVSNNVTLRRLRDDLDAGRIGADDYQRACLQEMRKIDCKDVSSRDMDVEAALDNPLSAQDTAFSHHASSTGVVMTPYIDVDLPESKADKVPSPLRRLFKWHTDDSVQQTELNKIIRPRSSGRDSYRVEFEATPDVTSGIKDGKYQSLLEELSHEDGISTNSMLTAALANPKSRASAAVVMGVASQVRGPVYQQMPCSNMVPSREQVVLVLVFIGMVAFIAIPML
ncbi:hypothetical protein CYMTET_3994 [Cymbomonas tetramitiformis]|uniref:Uncharacterized protein n=1 Tax=Cymbomonas tetramitiformis TaxID=36881 RepID=A0AAE0H268_9CHLO|nr:hypothetical protein CYMTET_3994 [Cymbomonas tetramitiformis]